MISLIEKIEAVRSSASSQDIELKDQDRGGNVCYDRISAVDYTNALTLLTVGMKVGANEFLIESFASPAAGKVVCTNSRVFFPGVYRPFIRVTGGSSGDRIALFVYGYITDAK